MKKLRPTITALAAVAALASAALPLTAKAAVPGESQIRGTVTAFDGKYDLHVRTRGGEIDDVTLHQGTIINPIGLTLHQGMSVTILGTASGDTFAANEIDTPYHRAYPVAAYYNNGPGFYGPGFYGPGFYGPGYYGAGPFGYGVPFYGAFPGASFGYGPVILDEGDNERSDSAHAHGK